MDVLHSLQILSQAGMTGLRYLPFSISRSWLLILNLESSFLSLKSVNVSKYVSSLNVCLNVTRDRIFGKAEISLYQSFTYESYRKVLRVMRTVLHIFSSICLTVRNRNNFERVTFPHSIRNCNPM